MNRSISKLHAPRVPLAWTIALVLAAIAAPAWADPACRNPDGMPVVPAPGTNQGNEHGDNNTTCEFESSAYGEQNNASGWQSSAFGTFNLASGNSSSAFGYLNTASGVASSAFGVNNFAPGRTAQPLAPRTLPAAFSAAPSVS